jgi:membrane peptidoglycan carboxypeptidase
MLGAQPVRPIDLAAFYAAIANEGLRPEPHVIESIERNGLIVYRHDPKSAAMIGSVDRAAFYQLKTMMQGVVARGTARSIANLSPYVAGKTGTTDNENDVWFVGITNDVTVAVWLGYDNADGKRRTLGGGSTGGHVAVPIFEPVIQAVWAQIAPKTALAPPSPEAKRNLVCKTIDAGNGQAQAASGRAVTECLRIDSSGQVVDTQYQLVGRDVYAGRESYGDYYGGAPNPNPFFNRYYDQRQGGYQDGYQGGYQPYRQPNSGYYYDSYGRLVPRPPAQVYEQRDPRVAPAPQRDRYGRQYQAPRPFWPWRFF